MLHKRLTRLLRRARHHIREPLFQEQTQQFLTKDVCRFFFFQFNVGNAQYFYQQDNNMQVRMLDTPHYYLATHALSNSMVGVEEAKRRYIEYLKLSWPSYGLDTSEAKIHEKCNDFLQYVGVIAKAGKVDEPVFLTRIPGRQGVYVIDGNHRCAIGSALGLPVLAKVLDFTSTFDCFMKVDEFYGMANKGMPYQSIYLDSQIVRQGRRDDIYDRLGLLPADFLKQKTVLDVGCNMGMNSIAAYKFGAKKVVGLELSRRMVNFATRFAVMDQCYPNVTFRQFDANEDCLPNADKYDIAFMLSIHNHLKTPEILAEVVNQNVIESVIFEGHPNTELNDYKNFLEAAQFSRIEKIADLATSVFDRRPSRPLWIFYK